MNNLILTARLDPNAQRYFDRLRAEHFPAERNFLRAHLTLFHALPERELERVQEALSGAAQRYGAFEARVGGLRSLGSGVAYEVECPPLAELRAEWARSWRDFLSPQDRQTWRPHITVQNKVNAEAARELLGSLRRDFTPMPIEFRGLDLWRYEGGPWTVVQGYPFLMNHVKGNR